MNHPLREGLPPLPDKIAQLPVASNGYPIPYFVKYFDGKPDFRVVDTAKFSICILRSVCWICGQTLGRHKAYSGGPLSAMNRCVAEPGAHRDCAMFAATACPHMTHPKAKYREAGLPQGTRIHSDLVSKTSGVNMVWVTDHARVIPNHGDLIISLGEPNELHWFTEGRKATRQEVEAGIDRALDNMVEERGPMDPETTIVIRTRLARLRSYLPP